MLDETNQNISPVTEADEAHSFAEYEAIKNALKPYIDGAKAGDGSLSVDTFLDHAHVVGSLGGTYYEMDRDTFTGVVTAGGAAPDLQYHIAWINVSGPAAAARVDFIHWGENRFTDFFVLFKKDGVWKISGKVFDSHSKN